LAAAWRRLQRDSGGGGSAKRGGGAQRYSGSTIAAVRMLRRWRQRDITTSAAAWQMLRRQRRRQRQRQRRWRQRDARQRCTARLLPARWQQHGCCGGFTGTVRECANARAFKRYQRADVRIFVLGRGRRDDSADGIVVVGSNGGARGDVHRGRRCAAAAADDADGNADDDIVC